jgi:hypothetical protein
MSDNIARLCDHYSAAATKARLRAKQLRSIGCDLMALDSDNEADRLSRMHDKASTWQSVNTVAPEDRPGWRGDPFNGRLDHKPLKTGTGI